MHRYFTCVLTIVLVSARALVTTVDTTYVEGPAPQSRTDNRAVCVQLYATILQSQERSEEAITEYRKAIEAEP